MKRMREDNVLRVMFGSWAEMVAYLDATKPAWDGDPYNKASFSGGIPSWGKARELLAIGSPDLAATMLKDVRELTPPDTQDDLTPTLEYGVAGAYPDIAEFCSGNPACMVARGSDTSLRAARVVRLVYNCIASAGVSPDTIRAYGAALLTFIVRLEASGRRVELTVASANGGQGGSRSYISVRVKNAEDSLDMPRLAFALAHPAFLRWIVFRLASCQPELSNYHSSQGSCSTLQKEAPAKGYGEVWLPALQSFGGNTAAGYYAQLERAWEEDWKETISFDFNSINNATR